MTALSLPSSPALMSVEDVDRYAVEVEAFAQATESLAEAQGIQARWAAVTTWIRKTSRDGVKRAEEAQRRIEQRIGELIQAEREAGRLATHGGDQGEMQGCTSLSDVGLDRRDAADFAAMANHADVLDRVIAESTDDAPPTRNRVRSAIRAEKERTVSQSQTSYAGTDRTAEAVAWRREQIRQLAPGSLLSSQIAERLGISTDGAKAIAREIGVEFHADKTVGRRKRIDPQQIVRNVVNNLVGTEDVLAMAWDSIESLEMDERLELIEALRQPLAALNRLKKELKP